MKNKFKALMVFLIIGIAGCHPVIERWSDKIAIAKYDRAKAAYLAKHPPAWRELYYKNMQYCGKLARKKVNNGGTKHFNIYYDDCMEERGTPDL